MTSGGSDRGARPILERHCVLVEKRERRGSECVVIAGTRKESRMSSRVLDGVNTARKAREERGQCAGQAIDSDVHAGMDSSNFMWNVHVLREPKLLNFLARTLALSQKVNS